MKVFPHRKPVKFYEQTTDSFGTDTLNERQRIRAKLYFSRFVSRIYIMAEHRHRNQFSHTLGM